MKSVLFKFLSLAVMLLGLPLVGAAAAGLPFSRYAEFPPVSRYVSHEPFSWVFFFLCIFFVLAMVAPFAIKGLTVATGKGQTGAREKVFPWWGWIGLAGGAASWILAWSRFEWFSAFQAHTFTPLWLSYVVVMNALTWRRAGRCMMTQRPVYFFMLFPVSALFWWFFEYLNRFVQNWFYVGVHFGPGEYLLFASLSYSTVLPAVLGTREWIQSLPGMKRAFGCFRPVSIPWPGTAAAAVLSISAGGLAGIGIWPNYLFPLLWMSPLLIIVSLQALLGESHIFSRIKTGDWTVVVSSAGAALFCGFFWEMWNFLSLAKWEYSIPFVHAFELFEMPLPGYSGYLPFGLECSAVGGLLESAIPRLRPGA